MRTRLLLAAALAVAAVEASAAPAAAPGFAVEVVRKDGAVFAGLAEDGVALLVTDLGRGRLYRWTARGGFAPFGPALTHGLDVIGDPTGPYRVARVGSRLLVAQGWTPVDAGEDPRDHALLEVDESSVVRVIDADFWNPFAFVAEGEILFVVDSGRNTVERLDNGSRRTLVTFPRIEQKGSALQSLSPTEFSRQKAYEVDAVPTGIAFRGGRLYVSLFGGFPYVAGGGAVVSFDADGGGERAEADGLNMPVGVAFDEIGRLMVLEHGTFDQAEGFRPGSGKLIRIDPRSRVRETLVSGLTRPAAVLFSNGRIVISELGGALVLLSARPK